MTMYVILELIQAPFLATGSQNLWGLVGGLHDFDKGFVYAVKFFGLLGQLQPDVIGIQKDALKVHLGEF
jgi:hypothetical protein